MFSCKQSYAQTNAHEMRDEILFVRLSKNIFQTGFRKSELNIVKENVSSIVSSYELKISNVDTLQNFDSFQTMFFYKLHLFSITA